MEIIASALKDANSVKCIKNIKKTISSMLEKRLYFLYISHYNYDFKYLNIFSNPVHNINKIDRRNKVSVFKIAFNTSAQEFKSFLSLVPNGNQPFKPLKKIVSSTSLSPSNAATHP